MVTPTQMRNAAATILAGLDQAGPALSEQDLLHMVIDFANGKPLAGPLASAPDVPVAPALPAIDRLTGALRPGPHPAEGLIEAQRAQLRQDLGLAIGKGFPPEVFKRLRHEALQMIDTTVDLTIPSKGRPRKRSVVARRFYLPMSLAAILARSVLMLRDQNLEIGAGLKQCGLASCGVFFFSDTAKGGSTRGRPRIYCCNEHMTEAHNSTGAARTRKWRQGK